jgi:hypothetical protein
LHLSRPLIGCGLTSRVTQVTGSETAYPICRSGQSNGTEAEG